jgi:hypothetical protein
MTPWLSQPEIDDLCKPLTQHAAQIRFIRGLGLTVREKPNGAALVMRTNFETVMNPAGNPRKNQKMLPDATGLRLIFSKG